MTRSRGHHFEALRRRVSYLSDRIEAEETRELEPPCEICEEPQDYRRDLSYDKQEKVAWLFFRDKYLTFLDDNERLRHDVRALEDEVKAASNLV